MTRKKFPLCSPDFQEDWEVVQSERKMRVVRNVITRNRAWYYSPKGSSGLQVRHASTWIYTVPSIFPSSPSSQSYRDELDSVPRKSSSWPMLHHQCKSRGLQYHAWTLNAQVLMEELGHGQSTMLSLVLQWRWEIRYFKRIRYRKLSNRK